MVEEKARQRAAGACVTTPSLISLAPRAPFSLAGAAPERRRVPGVRRHPMRAVRHQRPASSRLSAPRHRGVDGARLRQNGAMVGAGGARWAASSGEAPGNGSAAADLDRVREIVGHMSPRVPSGAQAGRLLDLVRALISCQGQAVALDGRPSRLSLAARQRWFTARWCLGWCRPAASLAGDFGGDAARLGVPLGCGGGVGQLGPAKGGQLGCGCGNYSCGSPAHGSAAACGTSG
jgi:hypothetical protein